MPASLQDGPQTRAKGIAPHHTANVARDVAKATLRKLREEDVACRKANASPSGRVRGCHEVRLFLHVVGTCLADEAVNSWDAAVNLACRILGFGDEKGRTIIQKWREDVDVLHLTPEGEGRRARSHVDKRFKITPELERFINEYIIDQHSKGPAVTANDIASELNRKGCDIARQGAHKAMRRLGYERKRTGKKHVSRTPEGDARVLCFVVEYHLAKKAALDDPECGPVCVWMGESFVHQGHKSFFSFLMGEDVVAATSKGKRLIIVHAISKDGPLVIFQVDPDGNASEVPITEGGNGGQANVIQDTPTAEWVWRARTNKWDYQANMDDEMFLVWLKRRLFIAFQARYPGRKLIIIVDNAPYHLAQDKSVGNPLTNTKTANQPINTRYSVATIVASDWKKHAVPGLGEEFVRSNKKHNPGPVLG